MAPESLWGVIEEWPDIAEPLRSKLLSARDEIVRLRADNEQLREAVREACLHQGLPEDAPPERVAAHFRNNREMREGFDVLAASEGAKDGA